jgi:hypothetical protein
VSPRLLRAVAAGLLLALGLLWWLLPRGIGELQAKQGQVERDRHDAVGAFSAAAPGDGFEVGDGLRTGASANADVRLFDGPLLKVRASTLVRFRASRAGVARVALERGEVSILTLEQPVLLEMAAGLVRVKAHSRVLLREQDGVTWIDVVLGRAQLEWSSARPRSLGNGERARIDARTREVRVLSGTQQAPSAASQAAGSTRPRAHPSDDGARAAPGSASDGGADLPAFSAPELVEQPLPDLRVAPNPSLTLLDPEPPTRLAFEAPPCGEGTLALEIEHAGRITSSADLVFAFPLGSSRYRLRCGARIVRSGRVRVIQDTGERPLAQEPPQNQIEADGLSYTVLYQTRLPELRVHWASAPAQGATLLVESGGRRRAFPSSGAQVVLPSGTLGEGQHRLWFEQPGGDLRSRTTQLEIRFDNATPLAHFRREPLGLDGAFSVSGAVVAGARVTVRGENVPLDASGRFHTSVPPDPGTRGFAVKVELPTRSVVYYVRRFGASNAPR